MANSLTLKYKTEYMKRNLSRIALTVLLAVGFSALADAQVVVSVRLGAPAYVRPTCPAPNYVWIEGGWVTRRGHYVWANGYWSQPRPGYRYVTGYWNPCRGGYYYVPGRWERGYAQGYRDGRRDGHKHDRGRGHGRHHHYDRDRDYDDDRDYDRW